MTDPSHTVSTHTPIMPPTIPTMNIKNSTSVLDEVGKIYDAIRFAEDPAGDVNTNMKQITTSSHINYLIVSLTMSKIPDKASELLM